VTERQKEREREGGGREGERDRSDQQSKDCRPHVYVALSTFCWAN